MEVTVGFTVKDDQYYKENEYTKDTLVSKEGPVGYAYYKTNGVQIENPIHVNYVEYPWISCFEVNGITIEPVTPV